MNASVQFFFRYLSVSSPLIIGGARWDVKLTLLEGSTESQHSPAAIRFGSTGPGISIGSSGLEISVVVILQ